VDLKPSFNPIFPNLAAKYGLTFYPFFLDGVTRPIHFLQA